MNYVPLEIVDRLLASEAWAEEVEVEPDEFAASVRRWLEHDLVGADVIAAVSYVSGLSQNMGGGLPYGVFAELRRLVHERATDAEIAIGERYPIGAVRRNSSDLRRDLDTSGGSAAVDSGA